MQSAEDLHGLGVAEINAGRYPEAQRLLSQAHARTEESNLLARIEASLAYVAAERGDTNDALRLCTEALSRERLSALTCGVVSSQRALLLMRAGRTAEALESFGAAIDDLVDAPLDLAKAHLNRGGVYLQQSDTAAAIADFRSAREHFAHAGDETAGAMAEHNLGYAQFLAGDLVGALRAMGSAYQVIAPVSPMMKAICEQDRAEVLTAAGLASEGRSALRSASRVYAVRRLHQRRGEAELALARTLVLTDPPAALEAARVARRLFVRTGNDAWRDRAEAVVLAAEVEEGRRGPGLVARGDRLGDALDGQGLRAAAASVRLQAVRVLIRRGQFEDARRRMAGIRLNPRMPLGVRLLVRTARTELATAQGHPGRALQQVRAGVTELHAWHSTFGSLDLQTAVIGQGRRLAILGLRLAVDSGDPVVLYEWSERGRMLASRILPLRPPVDEQSAAHLAELRQLQAGGVDVQVPRPRREAELRRRVRERAWHNPGSGEVTDPAPLADVRRELGVDTALVAWVISGDRVVGLVVTDEGACVHELGSFSRVKELLAGLLPDLDMAATELPGDLATVVRRGLAVRLEMLAELLVTPLVTSLGTRRVVATPSGGLAGTPWGLLPGLVGRPMTVAGSATSWLAARQRPLVMARAGFVAGPRVERAGDEVRSAGAVWPVGSAEVLPGDRATAADVADLAARVDVLHVAAHGRHSADNPLFSGLELSGGPWFGYDIDALTRVPAVVLLSACEVGRSSVRFGEELIGMTAAWLHAGARCVIASPTAVADAAAHDVLTRLHAGLANGLDPSAALAGAIDDATGGDVTTTGAPAPFVCFGAGW